MKLNKHFSALSLSVNFCRLYAGSRDIHLIRKIRFVLVIAVFMLSFSNVESQTIPKSLKKTNASTCQWVDSVESTSRIVDRIETTVGTLRYELDHSDVFSEVYKLVDGNLTWSASGNMDKDDIHCTVQGGPVTYTFSNDSLVTGMLEIFYTGEYWFEFTYVDNPFDDRFFVTNCEDGTTGGDLYYRGI